MFINALAQRRQQLRRKELDVRRRPKVKKLHSRAHHCSARHIRIVRRPQGCDAPQHKRAILLAHAASAAQQLREHAHGFWGGSDVLYQ